MSVRAESIENSHAEIDQPSQAAMVGALPRWKRPLDLVVGGAILALAAPVMIAAAVLVRLTSRGPVLFKQARVGRGERVFMMLKFRTMRAGSDQAGSGRDVIAEELAGTAKPDPETGLFRPSRDPRVTPVGRVLRLLSIDELPQLFNVVAGQMSLVGPRPAPPDEVELFTPEQRRRHVCLPGITGLWQTSGRNRLDSRAMLALDLDYAERLSLRRDLLILLRTPRAVLFERHTR